MSSDALPAWRQTSIGEVFTLQRGFDITRKEQRSWEVPVVSSGGISSFHDTAMVDGPGVVIGRKGTLGTVFYLANSYWPHDTTLWVRDFKGNDARFVFYFLKTLNVRYLDVGSANPTLNRNHVHALPVAWPERDEQARIVSVLSSLDDRNRSNRHLARLLEQITATLFKARFVDFLGVEDFEDSDIGPIPRGWRVGELADIAWLQRDFSKGDDGRPYIGLDAMPRKSTILHEWLTVGTPLGQSAIFNRGDILFGKLRPYFHKVGVALIDGRCSTEILVLRAARPELYGVLLGHVSSDAFIAHCVAVSRGTRMPRSEWEDASTYKIAIPPPEAAADFSDFVRTLYEQSRALVMESRSLDKVRDALLPKLISGAVRIPDAVNADEAFVGEGEAEAA